MRLPNSKILRLFYIVYYPTGFKSCSELINFSTASLKYEISLYYDNSLLWNRPSHFVILTLALTQFSYSQIHIFNLLLPVDWKSTYWWLNSNVWGFVFDIVHWHIEGEHCCRLFCNTNLSIKPKGFNIY